MIKIETIAATKEINNMTAQQLNDEQTLMSGKFAGTCYAKEGYATIRTQPEEKAMKRALGTAKNGHHSVFQHGMINMEITCPKMIAMLLNSIGISNTSEKSARYTTMHPETKEESRLYQKWHDIFVTEITNKYGERLKEKEIDKLAYENARYMISVFCETTMVYSLPFRNIFYVMDFAKKMEAKLEHMEGGFNRRLCKEVGALYEAMLGVVGKANFHDIKNDYFRFLPVQATGEYDENAEYYGDVYTSVFYASFAQIAQEQRHRTTRVKINFGGKDASEYGFFVPPILKGTGLEKEWLADMELIKEVYPQGTLVEVTEQGLFEDFVVKCKERMCGRAQLEIMLDTMHMIEKFEKNRQNLSKANQKRLESILERDRPCARCGFDDFQCVEGCIWGKKEALTRLI